MPIDLTPREIEAWALDIEEDVGRTLHVDPDVRNETAQRVAFLRKAARILPLVEAVVRGCPGHDANDHNCEDWPPGHGCDGCKAEAAHEALRAAWTAAKESGNSVVHNEDTCLCEACCYQRSKENGDG